MAKWTEACALGKGVYVVPRFRVLFWDVIGGESDAL